MFQPGTEWQARALADAAESVAQETRGEDLAEMRRRAYCAGVRDVLRVLVGDAEPNAELSRILARYYDAMDDEPDREPSPAQEDAWTMREDDARGHALS
jgi:hypothetical protein